MAVERAGVDDWFYAPYWNRFVPLAAENVKEPVRWLVFAQGREFDRQLVKELAKGGQSIVTVRAGEGFEKVGAEKYVIRAGAREDYDRLLGELGEAMPERMVHLWSGGGKSKLSGRKSFGRRRSEVFTACCIWRRRWPGGT